jgi:hypothetical protein
VTVLAPVLGRLRVADEHDRRPSGLYGAPKERA